MFLFFVDRFVCKNTGVLFETDILQVGIKSEFKEGKGKYKNNNVLVQTMFNEEGR